MTATPAPALRRFVPANIDLADFPQLDPLYQQLLARPLNTMAMCSRRCQNGRAQRCIEALKRHGLDERALLVRRLMRL